MDWGLCEFIQIFNLASPQSLSCWWQITQLMAAGFVVAADHVVACPGPSPSCDSKGGSEQRHGHNSVHLWQRSHKSSSEVGKYLSLIINTLSLETHSVLNNNHCKWGNMGPVNITDPIRKSNITSPFLSIEDPVDSLHPQSGARLLISWAGAEHTHHIVHHTLLKCVTDKVRAVGKRESISHEYNATRRVYQAYL